MDINNSSALYRTQILWVVPKIQAYKIRDRVGGDGGVKTPRGKGKDFKDAIYPLLTCILWTTMIQVHFTELKSNE